MKPSGYGPEGVDDAILRGATTTGSARTPYATSHTTTVTRNAPDPMASVREVMMRAIRCGCQFEVRGFDESLNAQVFDNHECYYPDRPVQVVQAAPKAWHQSLFSFPAMCIAAITGASVAAVVHGVPW